ncbi:MAG: tetratricopeptide repeat protein [Candidatus Melainabacteria bacterium]|nr:tetratricopeptide repeat protein [Candidatus Melainabacteria bacterium]
MSESKSQPKINRIYVSAICSCLLLSSALPAMATKMELRPLPSRKDLKEKAWDQGSNSEALTISKFKRRPDYRDEQVRKEQESQEQKAKDSEAQRKAEAQRNNQINEAKQQATRFNNEGVLLGNKGQWQAAVEAHENAVKYEPSNKQFRINLSCARTAMGEHMLKAKNYSGAAGLFRKALCAAPDNGAAGKMLTDAIKGMGLDPSDADTRVKLGDQLLAAGDYQSAYIEYQQAMQIEPSAMVLVKFGDMELAYRRLDQAKHWYNQAIVKDPEYGAAYRQLGLIARAEGDHTQAAASLRKALILDPKDVAAGQALVEIWRKQVAKDPLHAENHLGLAGALQLTGDFQGAEGEYRKLETLEPNHPAIKAGRKSLNNAYHHNNADKHKKAAETLFGQGLRKEALAEISQAVMLEPRNSKYQFFLGECLEACGDYKGAHQAYLTCVLIDPEKNQEAASRMADMQKQKQLAQPKQAVQHVPVQMNQMNQMSRMNQMPQMQYTNVPSNIAKNMYEGAQAPVQTPQAQMQAQAPVAQQKIAIAQPSALEREMAMVAGAEKQRDYAEAVKILRQLLSNNLNNADVHHRLAVNLMAQGQIGEAVTEFRIASALAPERKDLASDLARALSIHKRSLMSQGNTAGGEQ